jgi:hypothetical protein
MDKDRFTKLLHRMERSFVVAQVEMIGCTAEQIEALEAKYRLRLPRTYRRFLEVMGQGSGRLFTCDHAAVSYSHVLVMTAEMRKQSARPNTATGTAPNQEFELPADALIIYGRLGEQFEFIRCNNQDDSPVWYFNTDEWEMRQTHSSILEWLESWCTEAEAAIASGYFDKYPKGTRP